MTRESNCNGGSTDRALILIVDDDFSVRLALRRALESEGYPVVTAESGVEALQKVRHHAIELVLLDLNLPDVNGWDVFERLTAYDPLLPVLILTARPDQYALAEAAGATGIMEKPLSLPLLIRTIARLLHEPGSERAARILSHKPLVLTAHA